MGGADQYAAIVVTTMAQLQGIFAAVALLALYVISCTGIHRIARRRWIRNSWLTWVPIANLWVLGSLSDQYQYLTKGKIKARRWGLIALTALTILLYLAGAYCVYLGMYKGLANAATFSLPVLLAFVFAIFFLAGVAVTVVQMYICLYHLFCSCDPDNGKLFLILSILSPAGIAFIVFVIRQRDRGMPPKKQPPVAEEPPETEDLIETNEEQEGELNDGQEESVADA